MVGKWKSYCYNCLDKAKVIGTDLNINHANNTKTILLMKEILQTFELNMVEVKLIFFSKSINKYSKLTF